MFRIRERRYLDSSLRDEMTRFMDRQLTSEVPMRVTQNAIVFSDDLVFWPDESG